MKIIDFILRDTSVSKRRLLILAVIAGVANSLLLVILNTTVAQLEEGYLDTNFLLQYIVIFLLFLLSQRQSQKEAITAVEHSLQQFRWKLVEKLSECDVDVAQKVNNHRMHVTLTQGANTVSQSMMYVVNGVEAVFVLICASLYLLWLSASSFLVVVAFLVMIGFILQRHHQKTFQELEQAAQQESAFFSKADQLITQFPCYQANPNSKVLLLQSAKQHAHEAALFKTKANIRLLHDVLFANTTFYFMLFCTTFLLPQLSPTYEETVFQVIITIMFMMEPVNRISAALPNLSKTNVAITSLYQLEAHLTKDVVEKG